MAAGSPAAEGVASKGECDDGGGEYGASQIVGDKFEPGVRRLADPYRPPLGRPPPTVVERLSGLKITVAAKTRPEECGSRTLLSDRGLCG